MYTKIVFLFLSVALFYVVAYLVFGIWFRGKRNAYMKYFFVFGAIIATWALFNGISPLVSEETYQTLYPCYFILACVIPQVFLMYVLHFTESKHARTRALYIVLFALAAADAIALVTNPIHHEFIAGYDGLYPIGGRWSDIHFVISYVPLAVAIILLIRYIVKNIKKTRLLAVVGFAVLLPVVINVLYTFDILNLRFDITPFAFLMMFVIFSIYSTRLRLFDNRSLAYISLFSTFSDAYLIVDDNNCVSDATPSFRKAFPGLALEVDATPIEDVVRYFESITISQNPSGVIRQFSLNAYEIHNAEITTMQNDSPSYYLLSKNNIYERSRHVGFIVSLVDVSNNQRTQKMIEDLRTLAARRFHRVAG